MAKEGLDEAGRTVDALSSFVAMAADFGSEPDRRQTLLWRGAIEPLSTMEPDGLRYLLELVAHQAGLEGARPL